MSNTIQSKNGMNFFLHEQALVETSYIGDGTRIWAFVHILPDAIIGAHCNICDHVFIESDVVVGDNVTIKCGVQLWDGVTVENDVFIGPNVTFTNDLWPRGKKYGPAGCLETILRQGSSIGANATLLPGIEIGQYAMIAAGSVVTDNVPPYALVMGNPAKQSCWICRCAEKLIFKGNLVTCCNIEFRLVDGLVEVGNVSK